MTDERERRAARPEVSAPGSEDEGRPRTRTQRTKGHEPASAGRRSKTLQTVTIVLLLLGLLTAIFVFQNTQKVAINFLFWSANAPLAAAILLAVVIGGILAFLVAYVRQRQYRRAVRREHEIHSR